MILCASLSVSLNVLTGYVDVQLCRLTILCLPVKTLNKEYCSVFMFPLSFHYTYFLMVFLTAKEFTSYLVEDKR